MFVVKDDRVPNFQTIQKEGNCGKHHEIPFSEVRRHGVANDLMDTKHCIKQSSEGLP